MRIPHAAAALTALLVMASCSGSEAVPVQQSSIVRVARCDSLLPSAMVGRLQLVEGSIVSGAVTSREDSDRLWLLSTPPDGAPEVVAVAAGSEPAVTISLSSVFESATDISLGPGPDAEADYLYVADLRSGWSPGLPVALARIREPDLGAGGSAAAPEVLELMLPNDAGIPETMFVDGQSGDVFIVTSTTREVRLYRATAPMSGAGPVGMQVEASILAPAARSLDGAAAEPNGGAFALRTSTGTSLWSRPAGETVPEAMVQPACGGLFAFGLADTVVALQSDTLLAVDRFSHIVYELPLPVNLGESPDEGSTEWGNLTPSLVITEPAPSSPWQVGEDIAVGAEVEDDQPVAASEVVWELLVHRCSVDGSCLVDAIGGAKGATADVSAGGIGSVAPSRLELRATYSDEGGLSRMATVDLQPRISSLRVDSSPPGAEVTVDGFTGKAPFSIDAVVGDRLGVLVEPVQELGGAAFEFSEWSDGGKRDHEVAIEAADTAISAVLRPELGFVRFSGDGGSFGFTRVGQLSNASVIDVRAWVALANWAPDNDQALIGAQGKAVQLEVTSRGRLRGSAVLDSGAVLEATSTASIAAVTGERLWLRASLDLSTGLVAFYTSAEATNDALAVTWTQLGDPVETGLSGRLSPSVRNLVVGQSNRGTARPMVGKLFGAAWLADGRSLAQIDFSTIRQLTSTPPDFSTWGVWSLVGPDWVYVRSGAS